MCFSHLLLLSGKHSDLETSRVDDNDLPPRRMVETSYDKLDFSRPAAELKPHYHSTSTLKSVKSTSVSKSRDEGDGGLLEGVQNSSKMPISTNSSGYIQTALFTDPSTRRASSGHLCHNTNSKVSYLYAYLYICPQKTRNNIVLNFHDFFLVLPYSRIWRISPKKCFKL